MKAVRSGGQGMGRVPGPCEGSTGKRRRMQAGVAPHGIFLYYHIPGQMLLPGFTMSRMLRRAAGMRGS